MLSEDFYMKLQLLGLDTIELKKLAERLGDRPYRGGQVADWLYRQGVHDIGAMKNLPEKLRLALMAGYQVGRSRLSGNSRADDGTFKLLLRMVDGELVETVGMPYHDRFSCCVSTQAGCAVGCRFCATGGSGFRRNLTAGEIVDQVLWVQDTARQEKLFRHGDERVSHVVFMGMGEPLLNYEASLKAVRLLNAEMGIGMRNLTLSTIGYVPGIYQLAGEDLQLTLAVSLHAPDDDLRRQLVPGMARYRVSEIIQACRDYARDTGRRVTFEYCLLKGVNDGLEQAELLAALLKGMLCHVNLIPYNRAPGTGFSRPVHEQVSAFRQALQDAGIAVTQREQRGAGIDAACGQLRRRSLAK
jgi:23S rRNA (adenine2503-C2)-methyltransferase